MIPADAGSLEAVWRLQSIVRDLANSPPPTRHGDECGFCMTTLVGFHTPEYDSTYLWKQYEKHEPSCPWRRAREWVAANGDQR